MKDKKPVEDVREVDIENMSMEELREFIAEAEAEVGDHQSTTQWAHTGVIEIFFKDDFSQ